MIISINGDEGSGKSTISKMMASKLNLPRYYTGGIFREIAKKRGMTLAELHKICESDSSVDMEINNYVEELGKKENNFIVDSRTAWKLIPQSLKIYLKVDDKEAARRIFLELQNDNSRNEAPKLNSYEKVLENIRSRRKNDDGRYQRFFNLNIRDEKNYDFVLDTTDLAPDQVLNKVMDFVKANYRND